MFRTREIHKDLFWAGFLTGVIVGGTLGVLLGSEVGKSTRDRLERAAREVRSRLNGAVGSEAEEEPVAHGDASDRGGEEDEHDPS